jgi:hypothetical protein
MAHEDRRVIRQLNEFGEEVIPRPRKRSVLFRLFRALVILGFLTSVVAGVGLLWYLNEEGRAPREWAPYLDRRADQHRAIIVDSTALVTSYLRVADQLDRTATPNPPPGIGAAVERSGSPRGRLKPVLNQADLRAAINNAEPGDVIQLMSGRHVFVDRQISVNKPGTASAPITVRAARLGDVTIEANQTVVFKLFAPHWRFENLVIRGTCAEDRYCEHAFHVTADARFTNIRNNRLEDWNAAIKINGEGGKFPDEGLIEGNTMTMSRPRDTQAPVTPVDLVAASNWRVSQNFIADFARTDTRKPTYGGFFKGAGENNVFERNVIFCEWKLPRGPDQRVGLSLGGGGTGAEYMRVRSDFEQTGGVIRDNLIAFCSDVGVYVNKATRSVIEHNTIIDTAGIDVRFPESSADVVANLVDGVIRTRDGGVARQRDNEIGPLLGLFIGYHPVRALFRDPAAWDLTWANKPSAPGVGRGRADLCGTPRPAQPLAGAFEDYARCR